jgi:hypothetical protein
MQLHQLPELATAHSFFLIYDVYTNYLSIFTTILNNVCDGRKLYGESQFRLIQQLRLSIHIN